MGKPNLDNVTPIGGYKSAQMGQATRIKLRSFVDRIERFEAEKAELAADIREIYGEVKAFGFDVKVMRRAIKARKQEPAERAEQLMLLDLYLDAAE